MKKKSKVNIFIVATPLQYIAATSIAQNFGSDCKNCLFYSKPSLRNVINDDGWDLVKALFPPSLHDGGKSFFKKHEIIRNNISLVLSACEGAEEVILHAAQFFRAAETNFLLSALRKKYLEYKFSARIIPDGLLNVRRNPYGIGKYCVKYFNKLLRIIFPGLNYYVIKGDRIGADDKIVDRIYLLPNFPHEYNNDKVVYLPNITTSTKNVNYFNNIALVIGQPLVIAGVLTEEEGVKITNGIRKYLENKGYDKILYKPHPGYSSKDFKCDDYDELVIDEPLEHHFSYNYYGMVIGVSSTALLTARMILPETSRIVSYGMNKSLFIDEAHREKIYAPFEKLKIEIYDTP